MRKNSLVLGVIIGAAETEEPGLAVRVLVALRRVGDGLRDEEDQAEGQARERSLETMHLGESEVGFFLATWRRWCKWMKWLNQGRTETV